MTKLRQLSPSELAGSILGVMAITWTGAWGITQLMPTQPFWPVFALLILVRSLIIAGRES